MENMPETIVPCHTGFVHACIIQRPCFNPIQQSW